MTMDPVEQGSPLNDRDAFRRCLAQFATGVTVISTNAGGQLAGMTSNSFSSLSLDPPLVVWSIRRESRSLPAFASASHFAVSILAVDQLDVAKAFARSGDNKFDDVEWAPGIGASPVLKGVVASFECAKTAEIEGGDHVMIVGRVERYSRYDRSPLLFTQGRYARVYEAPDGNSGIADSHVSPAASGELTTSLMFRAYRAMLRLFEQARQFEELTYPEVILLNAVQTNPGKPLELLVSESVFDIDAGRDLAAHLIERGLLDIGPSGAYTLTAEGARRIESIVRRSSEMRRQTFKGLRPEDLAATLRVVNEIVTQGAQFTAPAPRA